jgi:hypothetical protein
MDGTVAAAGEDGVATGVDSHAGFIPSVIARLRGNQVGFHASGSEYRESGFQFPLALLAAAGIRVVEQRSLAHSVVEAGLYLRREMLKADHHKMIVTE